ncbi:MAG: Zn-dependent protease [Bdellovibrio sp. CG10_big_fil_rev_8_21_14_0_10_47_8]|nr:MAG: Zn-dependent protease [Bdellovibrio sp. CG10_big_fil_rev_8_21_14_0_10_47_8]
MLTLSIPIYEKLPNSLDLRLAIQWLTGKADWIGLRLYQEITHQRGARNGHPDENQVSFDRGVMVEVFHQGHFGYCGTAHLTKAGLELACHQAKQMAEAGAKYKVADFDLSAVRPRSVGHYRSPVFKNLDCETLGDFSETLRLASLKLKVSDQIVNAIANARLVETSIHYVSSDGSDTLQEFLLLGHNYAATAQQGSESQTRSDHGGVASCSQIGLETWDRAEILNRCARIGKEALELLQAPNCPSEKMDLILAPDQMLLQIHESIGHPLELDRILGDERNFAGWSFVKAEDFGQLQYGSKLMNATFDPSVPGEYASYAFDDCGNPAQREYLIKDGLLVRGLGSLESQFRSHLPGVANFRASSWNRAPIDRMANINLEPGSSNLKDMIAQTEKGILMEANMSWSIDDYRNKFQFGCEYARLIENGKLTSVVKNPNYRGVTVPFWNSLKAVGNAQEVEIYGTPWCGKGEPSQVIRVGHSSPHCLFSQVEVFGGVQ